MALSFTLSTLKTEIQEYMSNDDADFTGRLDNIIKMAEDRVVKDLALERFDSTDTSASTADGSRTVTVPTGVLKIKALYITVSGSFVPLENRNKSYIDMVHPAVATENQPVYWAYSDEDNDLYFGPTPDAVYPITMEVVKRPTSLVTDTTGTWISQNAADMLLYACLAEAERFNQFGEGAMVWENQYLNDKWPSTAMELKGITRAEFEKMRAMPKQKERS